MVIGGRVRQQAEARLYGIEAQRPVVFVIRIRSDCGCII